MKKTLFFVYGTLKRGHHNHGVIKGAKFLGEHTTPSKYTMLSLGGFPAVLCSGKTPIKGEVYETDDEYIISRVWGLEGYSGTPNKDGGHNRFYDLETIPTPFGEAGMFVFRQNTRNYPVVESGIWK